MRGSFSVRHSIRHPIRHVLLCLLGCAACAAPATDNGGGGTAGTTGGASGVSGYVGGYGGDGSGGFAGSGAFGGSGGAGGLPMFNYAGTSGGEDAGVRPPDTNDCGGMSYEAVPLPVDIFIVMDASGSMFVPVVGAWYTVVGAVKTFVSSPSMAGVGTALNLYNNECSVATNAQPRVPMAQLPGNAAPISQALDAYVEPLSNLTGYNTNTEPALRGAVQHQIAWQAAHPDRASVILLVTDGFPTNECGSLDVEGAAAQGFAAGIKTFVLGLGNTFGLDSVAAAGGTGAAVVAEPTGQGVLDKLDEIRGRAFASCTLNFNDSHVPPDVNDVSLFVTNTGDGIEYEVARDRTGGGWTLSTDGRTAELNGTLCAEALSGRLQNLTFANGCPSSEPPPQLPIIIPE